MIHSTSTSATPSLATLLETSSQLAKQVIELINQLSREGHAAAAAQHKHHASPYYESNRRKWSIDIEGARKENVSRLWASHDGRGSIGQAKLNILRLLRQLEQLVLGPQQFVRELVSTHWEHGALSAALEYGLLDAIPPHTGGLDVVQLGRCSGLSPEKISPVCRLLSCAGILRESDEETYCHTDISRTLVEKKELSSWVGFQLHESRIASANMADWLKNPNTFFMGPSAFDYAFKMPMHMYHERHPEKGQRFLEAMDNFSRDDPGNGLVMDWFKEQQHITNDPHATVVMGSGKSTTALGALMAGAFPKLHFDYEERMPETVESLSAAPGEQPRARRVFVLYGVLWILNDEMCVELLHSFLPLLRHPTRPHLLICDSVSPESGRFEPYIEKAFRRRDMTLMAMHNVRQRTAKEWKTLIKKVHPDFQISYTEGYSSHSCRGLWAIQL